MKRKYMRRCWTRKSLRKAGVSVDDINTLREVLGPGRQYLTQELYVKHCEQIDWSKLADAFLSPADAKWYREFASDYMEVAAGIINTTYAAYEEAFKLITQKKTEQSTKEFLDCAYKGKAFEVVAVTLTRESRQALARRFSRYIAAKQGISWEIELQ